MRSAAVLSLLLLLAPASIQAAGLIPGPGEPGYDATLAALAADYDRQFHIFNAAPFGVALDAFVPNPNDRMLIRSFLAQTAIQDFATFTQGRTVDDVIPIRGEYGDLGMFGGVGAVGEAYRYAVLRDGAAPAAVVDAARDDLLEAIESFAVYADITGNRGTIARGIRRTNEAGDAPEPLPATCASASDRTREVWRVDASGRHPDFLWKDNTSKDQMLGYVMALGAFWDAVATDTTIPQAVKDGLQRDALDLGRSLMQPAEVRPGTSIDLVIRDANDCLVRFHDLNPRELANDTFPLVLPESSTNRIAFNALAALGIIRTLYHISGDDTLRTYYYDELVTARGYPAQLTTGAARLYNMFANGCVGNNCVVTNFSNVNMAYVAMYGLLRYETDASLRATYRSVTESDLWSGPRPHMGSEVRQAFFDLIYVAFRNGGTDQTIADAAAAQLAEWPTPPYFDTEVTNCDPQEIAAGSCVAIDGTTVLTLDENSARGGRTAAVAPLPKRLRPTNNFEWRSDPRTVNGNGEIRLNPAGDFRGAYWLGRFLQAGTNVDLNRSPIARNPDGTGGPPVGGPTDGGVVDGGARDAGAVDPPDASSLEDAGFAIDAGVSADAGAAQDSGTATDASAVTDDAGEKGNVDVTEEGCACTTRHRRPVTPAVGWLAAVLLVVGRRRDRTRI